MKLLKIRNLGKWMLVEILWFEILTHFIKWKISLLPMETILAIPRKIRIVTKFGQFGKEEVG
jgi:hypothetical protein